MYRPPCESYLLSPTACTSSSTTCWSDAQIQGSADYSNPYPVVGDHVRDVGHAVVLLVSEVLSNVKWVYFCVCCFGVFCVGH